ncbi:MAG: hypothetical protein AAFY00_14090, partial [Bacteroidota bacterium]
GLAASLKYGDKHYGLKPKDKEKYDKTARFNGVALTTAGKELLQIIPLEKAEKYKTDFEEFLSKKHLELIEVKNK